MDVTTRELFGRFPRQIYKWRKIVKREETFDDAVRKGAKHTALFAEDGVIDKAPIDIDGKSISEALDMAQRVVERIEEENLNYIPVFSGRRGFHFYLPFSFFKPTNKETARSVLKSVQNYFAHDCIDEQILGVFNHCMRVPNTKHEKTNCYSTYLPQDFIEWDPLDVVDYASEPHYIDYSIKRDRDIREFVGVVRSSRREFELEEPEIRQHSIPQDVEKMLDGLIRPCLMEEIFNNPRHKVRTELVAELKQLGYSSDSVVEIISNLGWSDFDKKQTSYHVKKIFEKGIKPMSKTTLKMLGLAPEWGYPWGFKNGEN